MFFFFNDTATTEIYTLSLHDALPICLGFLSQGHGRNAAGEPQAPATMDIRVRLRAAADQCQRQHRCRSEEHTSELQSPCNLVCRLLLEKKNICNALPRSLRVYRAYRN